MRFHNFAAIVHDHQTNVGCAAVKYRKKRFYYFYFVCNYSMRVLPRTKIYEAGIPYTGCMAGRSFDYPSICAKNEPISAVPYPDSGAISAQTYGRNRNRGQTQNRANNNNRQNTNQRRNNVRNIRSNGRTMNRRIQTQVQSSPVQIPLSLFFG